MTRLNATIAGLLCLCAGALGAPFARAAEEVPVAVIALSSNCLMGATHGGGWIDPSDVAEQLKGGERYRVYGLAGFIGEASGAKADPAPPEHEPCSDLRQVDLEPSPDENASIAMGGRWNPLPRPVQVLSNSIGTYRDVLARLLTQNGLKPSGAVPDQTLRVDLDGDGTMEVLLSATRDAGLEAAARAGDFSVVLVQKIVKGTVRSIPVASQFQQTDRESAAPERYRIAGVLDVDGDGTMEIIVHGHYYEGDWTSIYTVAGDQVREVVTCGCTI